MSRIFPSHDRAGVTRLAGGARTEMEVIERRASMDPK
jgi:hypothetical protein